MEGLTMSSIVSVGVVNLSPKASHTSQVGAIRQPSSFAALRFLGRSNVTNFRDRHEDHHCRRSGSSSSIVCSTKRDETSETERPDESRFHLSAVAVPILAAVMVGAVQPNVLALQDDKYDFAGDRFAAPSGSGQVSSEFSSPSAGGLQPKVDSKGDFSAPSKAKEAVESVTPQVSSNPLENLLPKNNPFESLLPTEKEKPTANFGTKYRLTPVIESLADGAPITESSPFLKSGELYTPPATPPSPVRDEPPPPGTAPIEQREGSVKNVTRSEASVVNEKTQGNASTNSK